MKHGQGVVIGKFLPPHRGHQHLIETATRGSGRLTLFVCAKPTDPIPGEVRAAWIREMHPGVDVRVIDDRYDENDSRVWAENTIRWLGGRPDAVFTSEDYGERYAAHMGCAHVMVDRARTAVPCSGTAIRNDPYANWEFISPPVRGWFAKRVMVLGAESTGTTTMARSLAGHLKTPWVAEYGRAYSEEKLARGDDIWTSDEFVHIAEEQNRRENAAARECNRVLIGDTNSLATTLWHRRYMGSEEERVKRVAAQGRCDLYLLTGDEIPFVQDGTRDGEHIRHKMHGWFVDLMKNQPVPWVLLEGPHEVRLKNAVAAVSELFEGSTWKPTTLKD